MSGSVAQPRFQRQPVEAPGFIRGVCRMIVIVGTTFGAIFGGLWWSTHSTCAQVACRFDAPAPLAAMPQAAPKPAVSAFPPVRPNAERKKAVRP